MADAAAAPPAAPAESSSSAATGAPAGTADTAASKALAASKTAPAGKAEPAAWGDDDDAKFFELAKRSPYRARIKGEERSIGSKAELQELLNHAQRGVGASKMVEESKAERAAAAAEKAEAQKERELIKRARAGDFEARKALGLVPAAELRQRDEEWNQVPEEVRELYADRNKAHEELATLRAEKQAAEQERQQRIEQTEIAAAKRIATNSMHEVMGVLGMTEANAERMLPHVAGAIADLSEAGLELGVDMTKELIAERVKQRMGGFDEEHFSGLDTKRAFAVLAPRLATMDDAALDGVLPMELQRRIALKVAKAMRGEKARAQQGGSSTRTVEREADRPKPPAVLSPFRFGRG